MLSNDINNPSSRSRADQDDVVRSNRRTFSSFNQHVINVCSRPLTCSPPSARGSGQPDFPMRSLRNPETSSVRRSHAPFTNQNKSAMRTLQFRFASNTLSGAIRRRWRQAWAAILAQRSTVRSFDAALLHFRAATLCHRQPLATPRMQLSGPHLAIGKTCTSRIALRRSRTC